MPQNPMFDLSEYDAKVEEKEKESPVRDSILNPNPEAEDLNLELQKPKDPKLPNKASKAVKIPASLTTSLIPPTPLPEYKDPLSEKEIKRLKERGKPIPLDHPAFNSKGQEIYRERDARILAESTPSDPVNSIPLSPSKPLPLTPALPSLPPSLERALTLSDLILRHNLLLPKAEAIFNTHPLHENHTLYSSILDELSQIYALLSILNLPLLEDILLKVSKEILKLEKEISSLEEKMEITRGASLEEKFWSLHNRLCRLQDQESLLLRAVKL